MTTSTPTRPDWKSSGETAAKSSPGPGRPASIAAARVSRASLVLGALGLASAIFVLARLLESWRVTPSSPLTRSSIFGQRLSYPAANIDAVVIVLLAGLGSVVTARALTGAVREVQASRRFHRHLAQREPRPLHDALLIADPQPRAFCAGLLRPRVYVSTGAGRVLDEEALSAVLAHERHHARRLDPLRLATGRVLARALFFLPELADLLERQQALAELSADESAIDVEPANRSALARAMLSFSDAPASPDSSRGRPRPRRLPARGSPQLALSGPPVCRGSVRPTLLVAVAVFAGQVASGSATLALPFLSHQPCILVLAAIPAMLGVLASELPSPPLTRAGVRRRATLRAARLMTGALPPSAIADARRCSPGLRPCTGDVEPFVARAAVQIERIAPPSIGIIAPVM